MELVLQGQYFNACQQACCAMLAGVSINEIIALVGDHRMGGEEHRKVREKYGVGRPGQMIMVQAVGRDCIRALATSHRTLWLTVSDCTDGGYGHAVLMHEGKIYDPAQGINPVWPWSRYFSWAYIEQPPPCIHQPDCPMDGCARGPNRDCADYRSA